MRLKINQNLFPPEGYTFKDADGVRHKGESWKDLFKNIITYRERNGKSPGDPEQETFTQHCASTPWLCKALPGVPPVAPRSNNLNQHVLSAMAEVIASRRRSGTPNTVPPELAARRAAICATCPQQQALVSSCGPCLNGVREARKIILGGKAPANQSLHPCGVLGEDCVTMVHLDVPRSDDPRQPANCWRRTGGIG